jgi:hypothetical protein
MKNHINIYRRHLTGLPPETTLKGIYPVEGVHPRTKHVYKIHKDGSFTRKSNGAQGSPIEFLQGLNPTLTQLGAEQAAGIEADNYERLDKRHVESQIKEFRKRRSSQTTFQNLTGIDPNHLRSETIWMDQSTQSLNFVQYSESGYPLYRVTWTHEKRGESSVGIQRLDIPKSAKTVFVVEDPLKAVALRSVGYAHVIVKPNQQSLTWNDYRSLLSGKKVYCLQDDDNGNWEDSFNPFLRALDMSKTEIYLSHFRPFCGGRELAEWLWNQDSAKQSLKKVILNLKADHNSSYDESTYRRFVHQGGINQISFAQDYAKGQYWYGTLDGDHVHSYPVNCIDTETLRKNYSLESRSTVEDGFYLSKQEAFNAHNASDQLKPKRIYDLIREVLDQHIYFEHSGTSGMLAIWIMAGYVYKLFSQFGYLHLNGSAGTGKTTLLEIIAQCGFNGRLESQTTRAKVIEMVHNLSPTLCLDEFESSSLGTGDAYSQMLKAGYSYQGTYSKKSGSGKATRLSLYCPKALASIDPIGDEALESRTIPVPTTMMPDSVVKSVWNPDTDNLKRKIQLIKRGGYVLGLYYHDAIKRAYHSVPAKVKLPSGNIIDNRRRQILSPLLAIARLIDIDGTQGIEEKLLQAVDVAWYPENNIETSRKKELVKLLSKWSQDSDFSDYTEKDNMLWIHNECWKGTPLADLLGGKAKTLTWFDNLPGVDKGSVHLPSFGTSKSCTGFPLNLKVHKKTVQDIFSQKMAK